VTKRIWYSIYWKMWRWRC